MIMNNALRDECYLCSCNNNQLCFFTRIILVLFCNVLLYNLEIVYNLNQSIF